MRRVASWLRSAQSVTVLSGAGMSTDSGIPDFRGPQGIWTRDPAAQRISTLHAYVSDPDLRRHAWQQRLIHPAHGAAPNVAHLALVDLERTGRLRTIVTQNIDGLHQRAGSDPALVLELHGTIHEVTCLSCGDRMAMSVALKRVEAGEDDPRCLLCGGILKSATISFGQSLDPDILSSAREAAFDCDLFLAVGTSLTVAPAASLPQLASSADARVVVINGEPTPYDDLADAVLREPIGDAIPGLIAALVS